MELDTKYGKIKIFAKTIDEESISQIINLSNSPLGENANIRIMSDVHAGAGCVIGTTMKITDKICPNLVGVDIGCGVLLYKTDIEFEKRLEELDEIIRKFIPNGRNVHDSKKKFDFSKIRCWNKLKKDSQKLAEYSLGTLGSGNHFIEAYKDGYISVHSGSRNIGFKVAEYYQNLAKKTLFKNLSRKRHDALQEIPKDKREEWLKKNRIEIKEEFSYVEDENMKDYLHDTKIMQEFADLNRRKMLDIIIEKMGGKKISEINSIHNYIDVENMILRKGAISAQKGESLVIPLNMRDGILICEGKGNPDWNFSAPHGAGRLYSRSQSKRNFSLDEYKKEMEGIFTTCISDETIDEAPFAYKDFKEIIECIEPTVEIKERLLPIFNFKAN